MRKKIRIAAVGDNCMDSYDDYGKCFPGGNPVNVAVYIGRLGGEASYTGAVGTDDNGREMLRAISGKGVDVSHVQILNGKTAVSHVKMVEGDRVFGEYEEGVMSDFKLNPDDILFLCSQDLVVTGIWGKIEKQLHEIAPHTKIAFDFANKFDSEIVEQALPYVNFAFFSYDEESKEDFRRRYRKFGLPEKEEEEEQLKELMKSFHDCGADIVVITRGKQGSLAWDGHNYYQFGITECKVVDTMGAGDSYIAGFLYSILAGDTIPEAMKAGAENSAVTLQYSGAW